MATKRALTALQTVISLSDEADRRIVALAGQLTVVIDEIDAILDDTNRQVFETVTETYSPGEALILGQVPVVEGSETLLLNGNPVPRDNYKISYSTGEIEPLVDVPEGAEITAQYTVMGLAAQVGQILSALPELSADQFLTRKDAYEQAIAWIREHFGA